MGAEELGGGPQAERIDPGDISVKIGSEKLDYGEGYLRDALLVLEKCEQFLSLPADKVPGAADEAAADFDKLVIKHSQFAGSFLSRYTLKLVDKIGRIRDIVEFVDADSHKEEKDKDVDGAVAKIEEIDTLTRKMNLIISGIKTGLLVPGGGVKLTDAAQNPVLRH